MSLHDYRDLSIKLTTSEREVKRLRGLAQDVLDALNAEKNPDFEVGYAKALVAALAMLGKRPEPVTGRMVPIHEIPLRPAMTEEEETRNA